jgi:acetylornithine/N-succinyldiaminopimelate aminotransferase
MKYDSKALLEQAKKNLIYVTDKPGIVFERGKGMYLYDTDGKKYLDFVAGWGVTSLGHSPKIISKALNKQAKTLICPSPSFHNRRQIEFACLLTDNSCMDRVFFTSTGAEANECAVKIARKYGSKFKHGAFEIITALNSFHGRTLAMMSASGKEQFKSIFEPKAGGFIHVPYNDYETVVSKISDKTAAIMIEPVQGEGGVIGAEREYVRKLREICSEKKIVLIFDEVQTGIARTGKLFCYEHFGIEPDVITLAKGIGGGYPLSACMAKDEFCVFDAGDQGGTYTGQPLGMAAGFAVVNRIISKNICRHVEETGNYLFERLKELESSGRIKKVRGMGLLAAFDLVNSTGKEMVERCLKDGLLVNSPKPVSIRLFPPLIVMKKEIDVMLSIVKRYL